MAILVAYFGLHIALAIAMKKFPVVATVHAWLSLLVGLYWAQTSSHPGKVVFAVCYLAAAEVIWRMAGAAIFWEFGKYATCAVLIVAILRRRPPRPNRLALLYLALLLPSILLTCQLLPDTTMFRKAISSALSGPLALTLCVVTFTATKLAVIDQRKVLLAILGPVVGVAAVCAFGVANLSTDYEFGSESNFDTSGGFGPNQVSATLGWGMLAGFLWMQHQRRMSPRWWLAGLLILFQAAQATLTFSRTGIWMALVTIAAASFFMIRDRRRLIPVSITAILVVGAFYFFLFPALDKFTGHKLSDRYAEKGFGGREKLARADLTLAILNPLLGVGVGMTRIESLRQLGFRSSSHTEFTRLLGEHGMTGLLALAALLAMGVTAFKAKANPSEQSWTAAFLVYSVVFMMASGMRLAIPAVSIGLAMCGLGARPNAIRGRNQAWTAALAGRRHVPRNQ